MRKPTTKQPGALPSGAAGGSAPMFALPYADLQEIHCLVGMVCGWRMSLPTKMICQAKLVETRMITLNRIDLTQRQRLREAKAFLARFNTMFAKAQNAELCVPLMVTPMTDSTVFKAWCGEEEINVVVAGFARELEVMCQELATELELEQNPRSRCRVLRDWDKLRKTHNGGTERPPLAGD